jgi:lysophospholipase L1-like esterase
VKAPILATLLIALALPQLAAAQSGAITLEPFIGGRVVTSVVDGHPAYTYSWPGVYFEARFIGNEVDVRVDDAENNLYLYLDGVHRMTLTRPGRTTVSLKDLDGSVHVVRLEKASETQSSTGAFEGFTINAGGLALPPPRYDRRFEFIGDSYTVGYGNTARGQTCTVDDVRETTDTSQSFAPATAKHFNAAYRILASSGRGVVRNYGGMAADTMPVLYGYSLFDHSVPADDRDWTPDVVVVALGTNDFSTPLGDNETWHSREELRSDFVRTYVAFVGQLRAKWPAAAFILMAPTNFDHQIIDAVSAVADTLRSGGIANLDVLAFDGLDYQACDGHPSLKDEQLLTQLLTERIARLPKFGGLNPSAKD